jgi:undecaprenyl pyrophosphate synthase
VAITTFRTDPQRDAGRTVLTAIGAGFAAVMRFVCDLSNARRCAAEVERLMALPEAELQRRGLRRDEIVTYAFRNHMHD